MITAQLLAALIAVESNGDNRAVGDNGRSHGCLQIGKAVVIDVNRVRRAKKLSLYTWPNDCYDRVKSKAICKQYLSIYCTSKRLGRKPTQQDAARMWNGGPTGHKKQATVKYWNKVRRNLK